MSTRIVGSGVPVVLRPIRLVVLHHAILQQFIVLGSLGCQRLPFGCQEMLSGLRCSSFPSGTLRCCLISLLVRFDPRHRLLRYRAIADAMRVVVSAAGALLVRAARGLVLVTAGQPRQLLLVNTLYTRIDIALSGSDGFPCFCTPSPLPPPHHSPPPHPSHRKCHMHSKYFFFTINVSYDALLWADIIA